MPRFLLLLCAGAALTFEGCQTLAGDVARQDTELASYLQDRWVVVGAEAATPELFCRNGEWRSRSDSQSAAGHYVLKGSTVCVTSGDGRSCRTFSKTPEGRYFAVPEAHAQRAADVRPLAEASAVAISYACNSLLSCVWRIAASCSRA